MKKELHTRCISSGWGLSAMADRRLFQICRFAIAAMVGVAACGVHADNYPSKPIRVVVDTAPGGVGDIWIRRLAPFMADSLGQPLVIDNRPGATGTIAADAVAKSAPDGYTVVYAGMNLITYPASGGSVRYDLQRDFAPAAMTTIGYPTLAINSALRVRTVGELQAFAKQHPEGLTCGTSGQASLQHFACAMAARALGLQLRMIPYKANIAALQDAASGQIHLVVGFFSEMAPFFQSGRLGGLAVFSNSRIQPLPSVPTLAEMGHANMELPSFSGFYFPANTPQEVITRINRAADQAMKQSEIVERLTAVGAIYQGYKPDEFAEVVRTEQVKWKRMSSETGIKVEQ